MIIVLELTVTLCRCVLVADEIIGDFVRLQIAWLGKFCRGGLIYPLERGEHRKCHKFRYYP